MSFLKFIKNINSILYYPILTLILIGVGLYFTYKTGLIQFRLFSDAIKVIKEKPDGEDDVSSFQALMVSTASRVGTGNIVGVSNAICLGGVGAVFWMWIIAIIGGASAFIESTLAQIYKQKEKDGSSFGGPSYYIEKGLGSRKFGVIFAIALIATYAIGFNMLASFNLQDSFRSYSFYKDGHTSWIIGGILAIFAGYSILGGGKRIIKFTSVIVPVMGLVYVLMSLLMILMNIKNLPAMFVMIIEDAFNFKAIFGGLAGSAMVEGIKRGLYSNEAGMGSAPNAAASAVVSHPAKQGLVQMISVFIDTLLICTATAFMGLISGVAPSAELAGSAYIQKSLSTVFGSYGYFFISLCLVFFAFTTLLGNLFYCDSCLTYLKKEIPSDKFMLIFRIAAIILIFLGAGMEMDLAWSLADLLMGIMCLINIISILVLSKEAFACLDDYKSQRKEGKDPVFLAKNIGMNEEKLDFWK
uniref:alanine/glycine:cation symporter family protein n=1 Tax=Anaerococcus mediterraneensis TaxID=1870984 RepID=UPI000931F89E|nr:alanine/glycine:cation symporter family protein [Anaerococcus mediterraneensis]